MWHQSVYSKTVWLPTGRPDDYHFLTDKKLPWDIIQQIHSRPGQTIEKNIVFIMDTVEGLLIGFDGMIKDALSADNLHAFERPPAKGGISKLGRPISFIHAYLAPKGTPIPDINELRQVQQNHLEVILQKANNRENAVNIEPPRFTKPRELGTEWDRLATEFEKGFHPNGGATFTVDGKFFRMLESPLAQALVKESGRSGPQSSVQKKTLVPIKISRIGFLKVISVAVVAVIAGFGAWKLIKHLKDQQKNQGENSQNRR